MAKRPKARDLSRLHAAARAQVARACELLARSAVPGDPIAVSPDGERVMAVLRRHRKALLATPGVVGCGVGAKLVRGVNAGVPCVQIFVSEKRSPSALAARNEKPFRGELRANGFAVPTDVVHAGALARFVYGGSSIGPAGVRETATLGFVGREAASPKVQVGVTAMHCTGYPEYQGVGPTVQFTNPSFLDDAAAATVFGWLVVGTTTGVDAAKLGLHAPAQEFIAGFGPLRGWRPAAYPGDIDAPVQLHGARSGHQYGAIVSPFADFPAWSLSGAIVARITADHGDSGAALVDANGFLLGICTGGLSQADRLVVFSAASLVLRKLYCTVPYQTRSVAHDVHEIARAALLLRPRERRPRADRRRAPTRDRAEGLQPRGEEGRPRPEGSRRDGRSRS